MTKTRFWLAAVIAGVILIGLALGSWFNTRDTSPDNAESDTIASVPSDAGGSLAGATPPGTNAGDGAPELEPIRPSAPWLAAAANPVLVTVESGIDRADRISPAGGTVSVNVPGARLTLTIPPDALERTSEVSLTTVATIAGLPFEGGLVAAVTVGPEDLALRHPLRLTVQPTATRESDGPHIGFAVRANGELHLAYAEPEVGTTRGARPAIAVLMPRTGTYGVARGTDNDVQKLAAREPTDYLARLEHRVARAYPPAEASRREARFPRGVSLMPVLHAQQSGEPAWITSLVQYLKDTYDQVVVPKFSRIRVPDCSGIEAATADANQTYSQWMATVELLLPVELDAGLSGSSQYLKEYFFLVDQRREMLRNRGYTDAEINEITKAFDRYRDSELVRRGREGYSMVQKALTVLFAELYRCCMYVQPREHYPSAMTSVARQAEMASWSVDPDAMGKIKQCNCRAQSAKPGAPRGYEGTITFTESFDGDVAQSFGNRTDDHSLQFSYTNELVILGAVSDTNLVADYKTEGALERTYRRREESTCAGEIDVDASFSTGRDSGRDIVSLRLRDTGEYRLAFDNFSVELRGSERERREWVGGGCGPFVKKNNRTTSRFTTTAVGGYPIDVLVEGRVDPSKPLELKGTHTFEGEYRGSPGGLPVPVGKERLKRTSTVSWNLTACRP